MLERLNIDGYAIIDSLEVEFEDGLTVLSGETGAGKSILIGALGLVLGAKSDPAMVRSGGEETEVSSVLSVEHVPDAAAWLEDHDIRTEENRVIVRRVLKKSGRGSLYLQSTPMTRSDAAEFTSLMFDMHGQHEHQSLLKKSTHRELIDRFGNLEIEVEEYKELFGTLHAKRGELEELENGERDLERERELLRFAVAEIDAVTLRPGEEEQLERELSMLSQSERLFSLIHELGERLAENRGGALSDLRGALTELKDIGAIVDQLNPLVPRLESAFFEIEDISESVRSYQSTVDFSPERLDECEQRLGDIRRLEKKYGSSIDEVLEYAENSKKRLEQMEHLDTEIADLRSAIQELETRLRTSAETLSSHRRDAASVLEREILAHLSHLGMAKSEFIIEMNRREGDTGRPVYTQYGIDSPEFMISPNAGEKIRPLREIASGGEMSRIMLAIKSVLSDSDHIETLVFDEIDAGIGGQVAVAVGEHLSNLARGKQVLCITHLPTIAVRADNHFVIDKEIRAGRTIATVRRVTGEERVSEIARMLAGDSDTESSRSHARELLSESSRAK